MPFTLNWDNEEKTIIRITANGYWTWEEYHTLIEDMAHLASTVPHQVDVLVMDEPDSKMPSGSPIPHWTRIGKIQPANVANYVVISRNAIARALMTMYNNLPHRSGKQDFHIVSTLDEAYTFMGQHAL